MDEPIRVLQVVTHMNRGGLETMLMNYYRNIDRDKVQFDFLTHRDGKKDYDDEILALGGRIYHLPVLNPLSKRYLEALDRFFKEQKEYRIVHAHLDCMSTYPLKYAKKNGVPVRIAHSHTVNKNYGVKYFVKYLSKIQIAKYSTKNFACGRSAGEWLFGNEEFSVLNNAIDVKKFTYDEKKRIKIREEFNLKDKYVIGHVGSFTLPKNHMFLVEIFKEIYANNKNVVLMLVGDGELRKQIEKKAQELGISNAVIFLGVRTDISEVLQAFDCFLFPSLFEGLPVTVIEAQASGLKCILSDSITREVAITGNTEYVSLKETAEIWARKVLKHNDDYCRENMYESICNEKYDIISNARWLEEFYQNEYKKTTVVNCIYTSI